MSPKNPGHPDFDSFVKRQQPSAEEKQVDWVARRDEWLRRLESYIPFTKSRLS